MNSDAIISMFAGISSDTKQVIAAKLRNELACAIKAVNNDLLSKNLNVAALSPQPHSVFHAFRVCSLDSIRVVLLGQDPYINPGEAMGLSFSVPVGVKQPPSLRNIFENLVLQNLMHAVPLHGDLTQWAQQGVLLMNCAFTTLLGTSAAHSKIWEPYTDALLREISALPQQIVFILLGSDAQKKRKHIDMRRHTVVEWGHPSPLNTSNRTDNPKHFKYCTAFVRANDVLISRGEESIDWNTEPKPLTTTRPATADNTMWIFTDGGSSANGREKCAASWAFYTTDGVVDASSSGLVDRLDIPGEIYKSSNNRGELTAIYRALLHAAEIVDNKTIVVISDSEYSINCIDKWIVNWLRDPIKNKLNEKKNLDIIVPARKCLEELRARVDVTFQHVNSHTPEPADKNSHAWFVWHGNDVVDRMCATALGR